MRVRERVSATPKRRHDMMEEEMKAKDREEQGQKSQWRKYEMSEQTGKVARETKLTRVRKKEEKSRSD